MSSPGQVSARVSSLGWRCKAGVAVGPGILLLVVIALGLAVRLWGLGRESIWLDEATSIKLARMDVWTGIQWTAVDEHPPLYFILLHYWLFLGDNEWIIRGLSLLPGVLTIPVIYALGALLFDWRTGLLAALFLAVSPFHVWYSQEARMYSWLTLLMALSVLFAVRAWHGRHWTDWLAYVLATTAGLYTHYYGPLILVAEDLFFLYLLVQRRVDRAQLATFVACQLAALVLFSPWLPILLQGFVAGKAGAWRGAVVGKPTFESLAETALLYMVGGERRLMPELARRAGYGMFGIALVMGLWPARCRSASKSARLFGELEGLALCALYLVVPIAVVWLYSRLIRVIYLSRYMVPFMVPFVLMVARGVCGLRWPAVRIPLAGGLVAVMSYGTLLQAQVLDKPAWRDVAATVLRNSRPTDVVLIQPSWHQKPFDYYARGRVTLAADVPTPFDHSEESVLLELNRALAGHPRVWFIWETGHYSDPTGFTYRQLRARGDEALVQPIRLLGQMSLLDNVRTGGAQ